MARADICVSQSSTMTIARACNIRYSIIFEGRGTILKHCVAVAFLLV